MRFFGPQGFDGPQGLAAFFLAGPHGLFDSFLGPQGFFCSVPAGVAGASAAFAIGADANPANANANAATVDFLDIIFPFEVLNFL
ncbi:MAG: hypothetical protein A2X74_07745 [Polynucleobacter sp. GWA2_45_21]|nr:MAG: hypothetical protein A2X74_07745 [Polynucleobacter sp. GWA2_45_21]